MAGARKAYGTRAGAVRLRARPAGWDGRSSSMRRSDRRQPVTVKPFFFMSSTVAVCICVDRARRTAVLSVIALPKASL